MAVEAEGRQQPFFLWLVSASSGLQLMFALMIVIAWNVRGMLSSLGLEP